MSEVGSGNIVPRAVLGTRHHELAQIEVGGECLTPCSMAIIHDGTGWGGEWFALTFFSDNQVVAVNKLFVMDATENFGNMLCGLT